MLKAAFEGKLTQQWREKHKNKTEPEQKLEEGISQDLKKTATKNSVSISNVDKSSLQQLRNMEMGYNWSNRVIYWKWNNLRVGGLFTRNRVFLLFVVKMYIQTDYGSKK